MPSRHFAARLLAFAAACTAVWGGGTATAEDGLAEIEVRTGGTLGDAGSPVPSARGVWVTDGESPADARARSVAATDVGVIRMPLPKGGGTALVFAEGMAPVVLRIESDLPRRVSLAPGRTLVVRAVDDAGKPVPGADVLAEARVPVFGGVPPAHLHTLRIAARTASDGTASLREIPEGLTSVRVSGEKRLSFVVSPISATERTIVATLSRGATVRGRITKRPAEREAEDDAAAAREDAPVFVTLGPHRAPVAADGTFTIETVADGVHRFGVEGAEVSPPAAREVKIEGDRGDLDVEVWRSSSLRLDLRVPETVAARSVVARLRWPDGSVAETKVAPTDWPRATFRGLRPGDGVDALVHVPGCVPIPVTGISLPPGGRSKVIALDVVPGALVRGTLSGRRDGAPVEGAEIVAVRSTGASSGTFPRGASVVSGAKGGFVIDGVPEGSFDLAIRVPGVSRPQMAGPFRAQSGGVLELGVVPVDAAFTLRGRATDAPSGTVVRVLSSDGRATDTALADGPDAGEFVVTGLSAGEVTVHAVHDGQILATETGVPIPAGWPVRLRCASRVEIVGRLIDEGGMPVVAGQVVVERIDEAASHSAPQRFAVRDPEGHFRTSLVPGRWRFAATDGTGRRGVVESEVRSTDLAMTLDIRVEAGAEIAGIVSITRGDGTAEAVEVIAAPLREAAPDADDAGRTARASSVRALTSANGAFTLTGVPPGVVLVRVRGAGLPWRDLPAVRVEPRERVDLGVIGIDAGMTLALLVRDAAGPLADAALTIEGASGTVRSVTTDARGRATATGLEPGPAFVRLTGTGRTVRVDLNPRVEYPETVIDLSTGVRLVGEVATGGRPDPFARVVAWSDGASVAAVTDAFGRYELPAMPAGSFRIEVTAAGSLAPWRTEAAFPRDGEHVLNLDLPSETIRGTVRAELTGRLVPGALVTAWRDRRLPPVAVARARSDGSFELQRFPAGETLTITASAAGFGESRPVRLSPGRRLRASDLLLELPSVGDVTARLLDEDGRGISDGWLVARRDDFAEGWIDGPRASASPGGMVRLGSLGPGKWRISAGAPGRGRVELGAVNVLETTTDLGDVTLAAQGVIDVIAWRGMSGPAAGVEIEIRDVYDLDPRAPRRPDDPLRGADPAWVTDAQGRLRIAGLAAGTWRLRAAARTGSEESPEIRIQVGPGRIVRAVLPVR